MKTKTIYTNFDKVPETIRAINAEQVNKNLFVNIRVKPYHGKRHDANAKIIVG